MWHFDAVTFGNPNNDLSQTQSDQFRRLPSDVGSGEFKAYNPTGPVPVDLSFTWTGTQLSQFRSAWNDQNQINKGANWFTADLPLFLPNGEEADVSEFPYLERVQAYFSVVIGTKGTSYGFVSPIYDAPNTHGELSMQTLLEKGIGAFRVGSANNTFIIRVNSAYYGAGEKWRGQDTTDPKMEIHSTDTGEKGLLGWSDNGQQYGVQMPITTANWITSVGQTRTMILTYNQQPSQRYRIHVTAPYSADMIGYDAWRVTLPIEVDVSPELILS